METTGLISIDARVMLATLINFLVFFLIIKKFFYGAIKDVITKRQDSIDADITGAEEKNASAGKLKLEYEGLLADIKGKEREIIRDANAEAQAQRQAILDKAHGEAKAILDKANAEIEFEKSKAMNEVKTNIVDLSLFAAEKIIHKEMDQKQHEAMILDFIDKVGEAK
ncbi:F0F1 ATP synthase subunit B [Acetobacterium fimetarium]|uniref:ATP synthase subunit b n=1 Tax=Acetobacterium fimetarium TaxID=52691 RepID=A0ABR6WVC3_9FIRM|nr:F0F1 ATP synthase subunit B [Acetobacterium fimetarium]MBC3804458.1 F0F1 ATP synthase subunit B [Acetobacterium fimetarium]